MFKNRSICLFIATSLSTIYLIYLLVYFGSSMVTNDAAEAIGGAIATALVSPHMFFIGLGAIFGWLGFFLKLPWAALVGAILYCVAALMFILYAFICIPLIILGFVGYANQKKLVQKK